MDCRIEKHPSNARRDNTSMQIYLCQKSGMVYQHGFREVLWIQNAFKDISNSEFGAVSFIKQDTKGKTKSPE